MKHITLKVEDFKELNDQLERGEITQAEYDRIFTDSRFHGLMNTEEGKAFGSIMPFAVGGSALSAIEGTSPYMSKRKLQRERMGLSKERVDPSKQFIFDFGHLFETPTGKQNVQLLGARLKKDLVYMPCDFGYLNTRWPHVLAHPDGYIIDNKAKDPRKRVFALAEVKTTSAWSGNWKNYFSKGELPPEYKSQVHAYLKILGLKKAYVLAWNGSRSESGFRQIEVDLDEEYAVKILDMAEEFVEDTVRGIVYDASDIDNVDLIGKEAAEMYPVARPDAKMIDFDSDDFADTFKALSALMDRQEELNEEIKKIEAKYKEEIVDQAKELTGIEKEIKKLEGLLLDEVADNSGGIFTDEDGTSWQAVVERKYSLNKAVKDWAAENYPDAWDAITSRSVSASIKVTRNKKDGETSVA
jgi:hypothetical protein